MASNIMLVVTSCNSLRFQVNDLIHHRQTNEDGRVTEGLPEGYKTAVPIDSNSWMLGATETEWPDQMVEASTNESFKRRDNVAQLCFASFTANGQCPGTAHNIRSGIDVLPLLLHRWEGLGIST